MESSPSPAPLQARTTIPHMNGCKINNLRVVSVLDTFGGRAYVLLDTSEADARIGSLQRATLNGSPVEDWLDVPRVVQPDGTPNTDVVAVALRTACHAANFEAGMRVTLETKAAP